jgi:diguanylate cyclase (GGDEF)-like protein
MRDLFHAVTHAFHRTPKLIGPLPDPLTGLACRESLDDFLQHQFTLVSRGNPLTLIVLDLDKLHDLNGAHGIAAGDAGLQAAAIAIQSIARWQDVAARSSDDEIALAMPDTQLLVGHVIANTIRRIVESKTLHCGTQSFTVTVSAGVATAEIGNSILTPAQLLEAAESAMYTAKEAGRNRVITIQFPAAA